MVKSVEHAHIEAWIATIGCLAYETEDVINEYSCTRKKTQLAIPIIKFYFDFHLLA